MLPAILLILAFAAPAFSSAKEDFYIGADACAPCHQVEYGNWSRTAHFTAFDTLVKKGEEEDGTCYWCHTVGFSQKGGFLSPGLTPELEGVQCESCHGRGGKHVQEKQKYPRASLNACLACHTTDIDPEFDTEKKWEEIRH